MKSAQRRALWLSGAMLALLEMPHSAMKLPFEAEKVTALPPIPSVLTAERKPFWAAEEPARNNESEGVWHWAKVGAVA